MGVKISELPVASSANNNDSLILNHRQDRGTIAVGCRSGGISGLLRI